MSYQGVIFDLDGTLVDTLTDIANAVNSALVAYELPPGSREEVRMWVGDGIFKLCERGARGINAPIEQMADIVSRHYAEHRMDNAVPYPGIPELLDELNRRGLPMGVLSNKPHEHTVPMVRELFNQWRFAAVEGFREKDRAKPDPRSVWDIVETMKLEPENVIFVGDSDTDMKTAVNARCLPVGATWGYRDREDLWNAGAKHLIDQPIQLLDLF